MLLTQRVFDKWNFSIIFYNRKTTTYYFQYSTENKQWIYPVLFSIQWKSMWSEHELSPKTHTLSQAQTKELVRSACNA